MTVNCWSDLEIALAWCLAWGPELKPRTKSENLQCMVKALKDGKLEEIPSDLQSAVALVEDFKRKEAAFSQEGGFPDTQAKVSALLAEQIGSETVGLVYGGATKIKQYVFEGAKLPDVRGASALLDRINAVDIPAFFRKKAKIRDIEQVSQTIKSWLRSQSDLLAQALIPELIIYSTGGNILAFCPPAFVDLLADAIEARYTEETLTANSCAVGKTFCLLELLLGELPLTQSNDQVKQVKWWLDTLPQQEKPDSELISSYFRYQGESFQDKLFQDDFQNRKSFNELVTKLAIAFNQRRAGMVVAPNRLTRRYPPMLDTHPYLMRDDHERRSAIDCLEEKGTVSEVLARKRVVGEITKREHEEGQIPHWFRKSQEKQTEVNQTETNGEAWKPWNPLTLFFQSWVQRFEESDAIQQSYDSYYGSDAKGAVKEARSLREIGNVTDPGQGFVAYIYADGNNMGGYIQELRTPKEYQQFSQDVSEATEQAVYIALAKHLEVRQIWDLHLEPGERDRNRTWIHPFEIVTIGGDDVFLIVPADKALAIAQSIGEEFEKILLKKGEKKGDLYKVIPETQQKDCQNASKPYVSPHRYQKNESDSSANSCKEPCQLSMSIGVLITAEDTPIYYAQSLVEQLLKSAKKRAKFLKKEYNYYGGTIDFLVLKSVTMISSNIGEFRKQALEIGPSTNPDSSQAKGHTLKLYGGPYTLHEIGGLLETLQALQDSEFPKSQLYQVRSFLAQGKRTAILNYRYFRTRLKYNKGQNLETGFEAPWCGAKTNSGTLAPWMTEKNSDGKTVYVTIWRDLVDLLPFYAASRNQIVLNPETDTTDSQHQEAQS